MPRRCSLTAIVLLVPALASCGGGAADARPGLPPLTPEPGLSLPVTAGDPAARPVDLPPRLALARFLRGIGAGDPRVCALLTPARERIAFGGPGRCRPWITEVKRHLPAKDLLALRTVVVPSGTPGPGAAGFTVEFTELQWRGEPAQQAGVLAARFVLRRTPAGRWLIAG